MSFYFCVYVGPYVEVRAEPDLDPQDLFGAALAQPQRPFDAHRETKRLIPNRQDSYAQVLDLDGALGTVAFEQELIDNQIEMFKRDYRDDLLILGEHVRSIKVKWGVVSCLTWTRGTYDP